MLQPGARLGPYQVLALLGSGGAGIVYDARELSTGTPVALKVLVDGVQPSDVARLKREVDILKRLDDPHVVGYLGGDLAHDPPYIAMRRVSGESLAHILAEGDGTQPGAVSFPLPLAAEWAADLARALAAAHARGILHRDIKPQNVMIEAVAGARSRAVLIDFGLGRAEGASGPALTGTGDFIGTMAYASPEHIEGPIIAASDVYQWGLVVYQLLFGKLPNMDADPIEGMQRRVTQGVEVPVPADEPFASLAGIVQRTLSPDPAARPIDGARLCEQIAELPAAGPRAARPPVTQPQESLAPPAPVPAQHTEEAPPQAPAAAPTAARWAFILVVVLMILAVAAVILDLWPRVSSPSAP